MRAVKTDRARQVLGNEKAREQLREFLEDRHTEPKVIEIKNDKGSTIRLRPEFVPKAG